MTRIIALLMLSLLLLLVAAACGDEGATGGEQSTSAPLFVAIGASDAVGTGARDPANEGWVGQLHRRMPSETRLVNLGIGGLRLDQALDQALPVTVDLQPSVITVWLAVNDFAAGVSLDRYRVDLEMLLATLARDTEAHVYVANLPDLALLPAFRDRDPAALRASVATWNEAIAASAAAHDATLVDLYTGWSELRERPDYISRDGLHPSSRGHRRLAEIFWQVIQARAESSSSWAAPQRPPRV